MLDTKYRQLERDIDKICNVKSKYYADINRSKAMKTALYEAFLNDFIFLKGGSQIKNRLYNFWRRICREKLIPCIAIRSQKVSRSISRFYLSAEFDLTLSPGYDRRFVLLEKEDKKLIFDKINSIETTKQFTTFEIIRTFGIADIHIQGLKEQQAILIAKFIFKVWQLRHNTKTNKEQINNMVKFFKDGKALLLQTDANDERKFTQDFAFVLQDYMTGSKYEGLHEVEYWLKAFTEICCAMRGYKTEAKVQKLWTVGEINPNSETLVNVAEHGKPQALETTA